MSLAGPQQAHGCRLACQDLAGLVARLLKAHGFCVVLMQVRL